MVTKEGCYMPADVTTLAVKSKKTNANVSKGNINKSGSEYLASMGIPKDSILLNTEQRIMMSKKLQQSIKGSQQQFCYNIIMCIPKSSTTQPQNAPQK
jgi:hypothetical protein